MHCIYLVYVYLYAYIHCIFNANCALVACARHAPPRRLAIQHVFERHNMLSQLVRRTPKLLHQSSFQVSIERLHVLPPTAAKSLEQNPRRHCGWLQTWLWTRRLQARKEAVRTCVFPTPPGSFYPRWTAGVTCRPWTPPPPSIPVSQHTCSTNGPYQWSVTRRIITNKIAWFLKTLQ